MNFLKDKKLLRLLSSYQVKEYKIAIMSLDFETERPVGRIEGKMVSGSGNYDLSSTTRRTSNLRFIFDPEIYNITDVNNLISVNKKISYSIGVKNPFMHMPKYAEYGEIFWFKQGVYIVSKANNQLSVGSGSVNCSLIDKMAKLNGVVGGTLPASVSFHDRLTYDSEGNITIEYPLILDIIKELVHHYGEEHYSRIFVRDVPKVGRKLVGYTGSTPIHFTKPVDQNSLGSSYKISESIDSTTGSALGDILEGYPIIYYKGENVGYMETDLTYPGELVFPPGATVTQVLDEIVKVLGNFQYYYDVEGNFHFERINNFDKTETVPLNTMPGLDKYFQDSYLPKALSDINVNEFASGDLVYALSNNPDLKNIKNDFIVWGTRRAGKNERSVRYHLAIDERPSYYKGCLCEKDIAEVKDIKTNTLLRYSLKEKTLNANEKWGELVAPNLRLIFSEKISQFNWREELYRKALLAYGTSTQGSRYDAELLAEWRKLYNPQSRPFSNTTVIGEFFSVGWSHYYGRLPNAPKWNGYNVKVNSAPETIDYWLDIIDTGSALGKYSISRIGKRSLVLNNNKINEVFTKEVNDLVFIENTGKADEMQEKAAFYIQMGQPYCFISNTHNAYFETKNSYGTCYEEIRELLNKHLFYKSTVTLRTIPLFHLNVGELLRLNFKNYGVQGDFLINKISWQLGQKPSMTITTNETNIVI